MAVTLGTASVSTDVFAEPPATGVADTSPALAVVQEMQANLEILAEEVSADVDGQVEAKIDAILQQAVDRQIAALLEQRQQSLAAQSKIPNSVDPQIETLRIRADREPAVDEVEGRSIELAGGWREIGQSARYGHGGQAAAGRKNKPRIR